MKVMNTSQIYFIIALAIMLLADIAIIIADRIKYRKYYSSKGKMVVLRINNSEVRGLLNSEGLTLCQCAYYNTHKYLYTIEERSYLWFYRRMHSSDRRCHQKQPRGN